MTCILVFTLRFALCPSVSYVVVFQDGSTLPASQRAYHPDELAKSESLKIGQFVTVCSYNLVLVLW